jgi:hypothetical protein
MLKYMNDNSGTYARLLKHCFNTNPRTDVWQGALWWAAGPWWGDYIFGLEPTDGVAYSAYVPILQSAFAGAGSSPSTSSTTTSRVTTTATRTTSVPTTATTTRATTTTSNRTTSSPSPTGNCAARYGQCGVSERSLSSASGSRDLTKCRAPDIQAQRAVRAARRARRQTTGTPNACSSSMTCIRTRYNVAVERQSEMVSHIVKSIGVG